MGQRPMDELRRWYRIERDGQRAGEARGDRLSEVDGGGPGHAEVLRDHVYAVGARELGQGHPARGSQEDDDVPRLRPGSWVAGFQVAHQPGERGTEPVRV